MEPFVQDLVAAQARYACCITGWDTFHCCSQLRSRDSQRDLDHVKPWSHMPSSGHTRQIRKASPVVLCRALA